MTFADRLKAIRAREGVTQAVLCQEVGLSHSSLKKYESNLRREVSLLAVEKIAKHPKYQKYALWLITGDASSAAEQISPL